MIIAVNTRFLINDYLEGYGNYIYEIFSRITTAHAEHEFIFIFDRPCDDKFIFASNVKAVIARPAARHPFLWKCWYNISIPVILKKHKADLFISCDGFCSLTTKVPQCLVVHDLAFLEFPEGIHRSVQRFYKKYTGRFLEKAKKVITVSNFSKAKIQHYYKIPDEKIRVIYNGAKDIFHPLSDAEKLAIKQTYSGGKEYYVYAGAIHPRKNLINLLKAFSVFKKRQQSNMKLVLVGRLAWKYESFIRSLQSYKYRDDVIMTGYVAEAELVKIIGAAYGMVYPSVLEGFGLPVLEALKAGVPVITTAHSAMQEIAGPAALYANVKDHKDLAEKMMLLYKDERLRKDLIQKGKSIAGDYYWDKTAALFWNTVLETMN